MPDNTRPDFDQEIQAIVDYTLNFKVDSELATTTAYYTLLDSIATAIMALSFPACQQRLGPVVPGADWEHGVPIPGLNHTLEPVQAAFNIGAMIRWLDFNDTWLAAEWGHPSDNLGAILAVADYVSRQDKNKKLTISHILEAMIKAHEIQGVLALENSFNRVGLDHVILVKIASTAISCQLLGLDREQTLAAVSNAWVDGQSLRTYRHLPNAGPRKSWAAGDATARAVRLALMAQQGEMGYPSALTAQTWGFQDVLFNGKPLQRQQDYASYVMENILWKISFPAEFHAQTAVECALQLHPTIKDKLDDIQSIEIHTHEAAMRIINKTGPLHNPADRDHCLQYMVAIGLIFGELEAQHYEDTTAQDPRIDQLRKKMLITETPSFSQDYLDPSKRSIANAMQITFNDGTQTDLMTVEYPIGHRRRRQEGIPKLIAKFKQAISEYYEPQKAQTIIDLALDFKHFIHLDITEWMDRLHGQPIQQNTTISNTTHCTE